MIITGQGPDFDDSYMPLLQLLSQDMKDREAVELVYKLMSILDNKTNRTLLVQIINCLVYSEPSKKPEKNADGGYDLRSVDGVIVPTADTVKIFTCSEGGCDHPHLVLENKFGVPFAECVLGDRTLAYIQKNWSRKEGE